MPLDRTFALVCEMEMTSSKYVGFEPLAPPVAMKSRNVDHSEKGRRPCVTLHSVWYMIESSFSSWWGTRGARIRTSMCIRWSLGERLSLPTPDHDKDSSMLFTHGPIFHVYNVSSFPSEFGECNMQMICGSMIRCHTKNGELIEILSLFL